MAWANGIVVKRATLTPSPLVNVDWDASGFVTPQRATAFYLGGYLAEQRFDPRATRARNSREDLVNAAREFRKIVFADIEALLEEID